MKTFPPSFTLEKIGEKEGYVNEIIGLILLIGKMFGF